VADEDNNRIHVLSADLQQVSTVAGNGEQGHRDGAVVQAQFFERAGLTLLPDGRVLVMDHFNDDTGIGCIRVLSADLQQVSTLTNAGELDDLTALQLLPDGRLLVGGGSRIHVFEGFPAALLGAKPSYKRPKKTNNSSRRSAPSPAARARLAAWCRSAAAWARAAAAWRRRRPAATARARSSRAARRRRPSPSSERERER